MAVQESRNSEYYDKARQANKQLWEAINNLTELQRQWNALDYGNTLTDGVGTNEGLTKAEIGAVVFDTANAMQAVLNAGHGTNMAKLL
jgi:hypothetical protein